MKILPINTYCAQNHKIQNNKKNNTAFKGEFIKTEAIETILYYALWNEKRGDIEIFKNLLKKIKKVNDGMFFWIEKDNLYKQFKDNKSTTELLTDFSDIPLGEDSLYLKKVNKTLETFYKDKLSSEDEEDIIIEEVTKLMRDKK